MNIKKCITFYSIFKNCYANKDISVIVRNKCFCSNRKTTRNVKLSCKHTAFHYHKIHKF